jgi:hypothetical protein
MRREGAARCSEGSPRLREAELLACRTAVSSRRPLSSPWICRPSVVDGSGIVRSNIVATARLWPAPLKVGGGIAWHRQRYGAGRPGPDDALLRRVPGLPTPVRYFARATQVAPLLRRAWPASRGVAQAVCLGPPQGLGPRLAPTGFQRETQVQGRRYFLVYRGGFLRRDSPDRCGSTRELGRNPRRQGCDHHQSSLRGSGHMRT